MNLNKFFIITLSVLSLSTAHSQTPRKRNRLEFSIGYNSGSLKNLELAPVAKYNYNGVQYKFHYERISRKQNVFEIELDFLPKTEIKTGRLSFFNTEILKTGMNFSYLKQLHNKNSLSIHLGIQSLSNISFFYNKSDYFYFHQEFGITSRFQFQLNKKQYLSSRITIPFLLLRVTNAKATTRSFNRYQSILWNFKYGYVLSKHFDLKLTYDFIYNRLQVPSAYREIQHQINLGITYKF